MNVLFIGGTGFISTAVSRMLVAMGIDLWMCPYDSALCRLSTTDIGGATYAPSEH